MDNANPGNFGGGEAVAQMTSNAGNVTWRQADDAWTHSAPVEGFFAVLTIVIVPVAILRGLRRWRSLSFAAIGRRQSSPSKILRRS